MYSLSELAATKRKENPKLTSRSSFLRVPIDSHLPSSLDSSLKYHEVKHDLKKKGIDGSSHLSFLHFPPCAEARAQPLTLSFPLPSPSSPSHRTLSPSSSYQHSILTPAGGDLITLNLPQMLKNKDLAVSSLTGGVEKYLFGKYKVDYLKGNGSFVSASEIKVELNDGGEEIVSAKNVIIATGSEVTPFPGIEIDEKVIVSSTGALDLQEVPKKVSFSFRTGLEAEGAELGWSG